MEERRGLFKSFPGKCLAVSFLGLAGLIVSTVGNQVYDGRRTTILKEAETTVVGKAFHAIFEMDSVLDFHEYDIKRGQENQEGSRKYLVQKCNKLNQFFDKTINGKLKSGNYHIETDSGFQQTYYNTAQTRKALINDPVVAPFYKKYDNNEKLGCYSMFLWAGSVVIGAGFAISGIFYELEKCGEEKERIKSVKERRKKRLNLDESVKPNEG